MEKAIDMIHAIYLLIVMLSAILKIPILSTRPSPDICFLCSLIIALLASMAALLLVR